MGIAQFLARALAKMLQEHCWIAPTLLLAIASKQPSFCLVTTQELTLHIEVFYNCNPLQVE